MKRLFKFTTPIFLLMICMSAIVFADHRHYDVRYDAIVQHSQDLEYIAVELKDCFRDSFRQSRVYGRLVSRSAKIKNRARSLYRHGTSRGTCNWENEIQRLDDAVCDLRDTFAEAVQRSRVGYDAPLCPIAVRGARKLIAKANFHVKELKRALYFNRTAPRHGVYNRPLLNEPAPAYVPPQGVRFNQGIGSGVYRNQAGYRPHWTQSTYNRSFNHVRQYSSSSIGRGLNGAGFGRSGVGFNVGGVQFYLNR